MVVHKLIFVFFTGELYNNQDGQNRSEKLYTNDEEDVVVQQPETSDTNPEITSHIWMLYEYIYNTFKSSIWVYDWWL